MEQNVCISNLQTRIETVVAGESFCLHSNRRAALQVSVYL